MRRCILLANLRWAMATRDRGDRLQAEAEAAYDEALRQVAVADGLAGRGRRVQADP